MDVNNATLKSLKAYVGGLSKPSKMPGYSYGLPAQKCKVGGMLAAIKGTVCYNCYALKGNYSFKSTKASQHRKLASIKKPHWVDVMVRLIGHYSPEVFRWHDSGDVQDLHHLESIVQIAKALPGTKFWLPTREVNLVRTYLETGARFPTNLVVRISAFIRDTYPPRYKLPVALPTSTVHSGTHDHTTNGLACRANTREGKCGPCRACWSPKVANVSYPAH